MDGVASVKVFWTVDGVASVRYFGQWMGLPVLGILDSGWGCQC